VSERADWLPVPISELSGNVPGLTDSYLRDKSTRNR